MRHLPGLSEAERSQLETAREAWRRWRLAGASPDAPAPAVPEVAQRRALAALDWVLLRLRDERPVLLLAGSGAIVICLSQSLWRLLAAAADSWFWRF